MLQVKKGLKALKSVPIKKEIKSEPRSQSQSQRQSQGQGERPKRRYRPKRGTVALR